MTIGGNLPPGYYALLFSISSTGSFICPGVQPRLDLPRPLITQSYGVFTPEQDNDETNVEPVHSYDAFHTWFVGPGVKGIIGMRRFNICLVVVLSLSCVVLSLSCSGVKTPLGYWGKVKPRGRFEPPIRRSTVDRANQTTMTAQSEDQIYTGVLNRGIFCQMEGGGGLYIYNIYACSKYS